MIIEIYDVGERIAKLKDIVTRLPEANSNTISYLMKHLVKVRASREVSKMDASNLAIVFGPTLLRPAKEGANTVVNMQFQSCVVETMILHYDEIFRK